MWLSPGWLDPAGVGLESVQRRQQQVPARPGCRPASCRVSIPARAPRPAGPGARGTDLRIEHGIDGRPLRG